MISELTPRSSAGRCQSVRLWLHDADGQRVGQAYGDEIWMERTAEMAGGQPFRHMMAYLVPLFFPRAGTYRLTAVVGDTEPKSVAFQVRLVDPAMQPRRDPRPIDWRTSSVGRLRRFHFDLEVRPEIRSFGIEHSSTRR